MADTKQPTTGPSPSSGAVQVKPGVFRSTTSSSIFTKSTPKK
jgi:hypothetical protein